MRIFKTITFLVGFNILLVFFTASAVMAIPINAGNSGTYTYGWDLWADGSKFNTDTTHESNVYYHYESGWQRAYLRVDGTGSVTWHFQTDLGSSFDDDVTVKANAQFFSTGGNYIRGEWSTDGSNYNVFQSWDDTTGGGTFSLSDTGFTGGSDLFVRFTLHRQTGNYIAVQLLRSMPDQEAFMVSGTVNPVPEPTTMLLLGSGLIGLAGFRRKWATKGRS